MQQQQQHAAIAVLDPPGSQDKVAATMAAFADRMRERTRHHLGYPYNLDILTDAAALRPLDGFSINNLGDPFVGSNYGVNSREFELGVLDWFAQLWHADGDYWGYVTCCGTEGNLHGIYTGREMMGAGAVLYASAASHYSVFKAARMFGMELVRVATTDDGEIDCVDLAAQLEAHHGRPAVVNVNIGTTVTGAVDDLDGVLATLEAAGLAAGKTFYVHCDGALFGLMAPFMLPEDDDDADRAYLARRAVTFRKAIGSVSVSGHKFLGAPVPCGVVLTRGAFAARLATEVEYLGSRDVTIMGSRNGHAALQMWCALSRKGADGLRNDVSRCLRNAQLLVDLLNRGVKAADDTAPRARRGRATNIVTFPRPSPDVVRKWQLACQGDIAHVVVMPSVDADTLRAFAADLLC